MTDRTAMRLPGAPEGSARDGRWLMRLALVAALGLVLRVLHGIVIAADLPLGPDATWYTLQAAILAGGHGYLDPMQFFSGNATATAAFPPLWPLLLSFFSWIGTGDEQTYRVVGATVGTATVVLTGFLGRAVAGPACGLLAAGAVAVSPLLIGADGSLMSDGLAVALLTGAALAATLAVRRPGPGRFAVVGLLGGLATLARSDALLYLAFLVVAMDLGRARSRESLRRRLGLPLVTLVAAGLVVAPWVVRNQIELGRPVLSSNLGTLVAGANCPTTYSGGLIGMWDPACGVPGPEMTGPELDRMSQAIGDGLGQVGHQPERFPVVAVVRAVRAFGLWNPVSQVREEAIETRDEGWQMFAWGSGLVAIVLAAAGAVVLWRRRAPAWPLAAMVAASITVVALSWGNSRFRLASVPAMAVAAGAFLGQRRPFRRLPRSAL